MKPERDMKDLTAIVLLVFIVVIAASLWFFNLLAQQRIFALLLGAELVAFSMLIYIYMEETSKLKKRWVITGFTIVGILILVAIIARPLVLTPNVTIVLYAGGVANSTELGFGFSANNITTPGPTIILTVGDVVNMTLINVGQMPHDWAIVNANQSNAAVVFNAQVASAQNPLIPGTQGSDIFPVNQAGDFFYICQVPGHLALGMWGRVIVNS